MKKFKYRLTVAAKATVAFFVLFCICFGAFSSAVVVIAFLAELCFGDIDVAIKISDYLMFVIPSLVTFSVLASVPVDGDYWLSTWLDEARHEDDEVPFVLTDSYHYEYEED